MKYLLNIQLFNEIVQKLYMLNINLKLWKIKLQLIKVKDYCACATFLNKSKQHSIKFFTSHQCVFIYVCTCFDLFTLHFFSLDWGLVYSLVLGLLIEKKSRNCGKKRNSVEIRLRITKKKHIINPYHIDWIWIYIPYSQICL